MTTEMTDARKLWADRENRERAGALVHSITNLVVMNFNANALLALGASPVMAHAELEVRDMVGIAQALVLLNIGTLEPDWIRAMKLALAAARERGIPVASIRSAPAPPYRNAALADLLQAGAPTIVRGNASRS